MSWKQVNEEIQKMEQMVSDMDEEETEEQDEEIIREETLIEEEEEEGYEDDEEDDDPFREPKPQVESEPPEEYQDSIEDGQHRRGPFESLQDSIDLEQSDPPPSVAPSYAAFRMEQTPGSDSHLSRFQSDLEDLPYSEMSAHPLTRDDFRAFPGAHFQDTFDTQSDPVSIPTFGSLDLRPMDSSTSNELEMEHEDPFEGELQENSPSFSKPPTIVQMVSEMKKLALAATGTLEQSESQQQESEPVRDSKTSSDSKDNTTDQHQRSSDKASSYQRYPSPRPPNISIPEERKGSAGILRLDGTFSTRRRSSTEPISPTPSADRLSVSFALDEAGSPSSADTRVSIDETEYERTPPGIAENQSLSIPMENVASSETNPGKVEEEPPERDPVEEAVAIAVGGMDSADDEYTDSLMEIARSRSRQTLGRRRSSNLEPGRRLSTTSSLIRRRASSGFSGDNESLLTRTSNSGVSKSDLETLKLHKEVIEQTKNQFWPLDKKLRVIKQAKDYVRRHEDELQEKFAQRRTMSSTIQSAKLVIIRFLQFLWRNLKEKFSEITPWQGRIKDIESHFGSVVSSYFIFLRWLFWMNVIITLAITIFVIVPEVLAADRIGTGARKKMLPVEELYAWNLKVMWDFEGILRYSPIFYGFFSSKPATKAGYQIPLAYFCAGMAVYIFSFAIILKKMAHNSKQSKLSEKGDECTFTWKVYTSWDYGIANIETAHNKVASIIMGFREALVEEMEREKQQEKSWKTIGKRVFANFLVLMLLIGSAYAVILVVDRSTQPEAETSWYRQNEITIVMSMISIAVPNFFDVIGLLEMYHPRKAMRWMLARIMALNLLSLYTLIFALFGKTDDMINTLRKMEEMKNAGVNFGLEPVTEAPPIDKDCFQVPIPCSLLSQEADLPPILSLYYEFDENGVRSGNLSSARISKTNASSSTSNVPTTMMTFAAIANTTDFKIASSDIYSTQKSSSPADHMKEPTRDPDMVKDWLKNLTLSRGQNEDCDSCIYRCGINCQDLCHIMRNCSESNLNFTKSLNATENMTTLLVFLRGLLNNTESIPADGINDEFESCYKCTLLAPNRTQAPPESFQSIEPTPPLSSDIGFIPIEERHCTKQICRRRFFGSLKPTQIQPPRESCANAENKYINDLKERLHLRQLCWETMFGQELVKLTVMDTVFTLMTIFIGDFLRAVFLRVVNPCWFWDMEKKFPKYPDFKVAENILHLVNNQGMIWMGLFMAPGLPALNVVKLAIIMYARSWAVMTTNVPHETVFRASRSNNFYFILLLMMLFLCTLPVAYTIVWLKPSWHCGPFSEHDRMYKVFTHKILEILPRKLHGVLDYFTSPGVVIPVFVLLILIIYYLISLTGLLRESNEDLKIQLHHERTEERRKLLQSKQGGGAGTGNLSDRWKKLLGSALQSARQSEDIRRTSEGTTRTEHQVAEIENSEVTHYNERAIDVPGAENPPIGQSKPRLTRPPMTIADIIRAKMRAKKESMDAQEDDLASAEQNRGLQSGNSSVTPNLGDKGSMCNRFTLETESSSMSNNGRNDEDSLTDSRSHGNRFHLGDGLDNESELDEDGNRVRPPKIWISKSASMEHDLD